MNTLKELYEYREMIVSLIHRELRGKYKASVLGFLWTFLNPLFQLSIYTVVFSIILRAGIEDFYLYLFVGLVPWNFFSASVAGGAGCVVSQENLIKKIYFPRMVLPIACVTSAFINMLLTSIITFVFIIFSGRGVNVQALLWFPIIALIQYIFTLGICKLSSALTVFFRDLEYFLGIIMMAWMYLTPIMYKIDMVPEDLRYLFNLNPMTSIISAYQDILYYKRVPNFQTLITASVIGIAFLLLGSVVFNKLQKKFVEEL
ncbi:ABC transporter permease [Lacrimispora sp.]|uniref:ABC transporter permease n=1 Tax=Lacrimispora sp. TaxID=2719234 RepID=UPI002864B5E0|nr:ABC transporter permease [Lacrimispora sp.]MDR7814999.1 ABC transporter permease [Lacrimispora sp.]